MHAPDVEHVGEHCGVVAARQQLRPVHRRTSVRRRVASRRWSEDRVRVSPWPWPSTDASRRRSSATRYASASKSSTNSVLPDSLPPFAVTPAPSRAPLAASRHRDADDRFAGGDARQPLGLLVGAAGAVISASGASTAVADERHRRNRARRAPRATSAASSVVSPRPPCSSGMTRPGTPRSTQTVPEILRAAFAAVGESRARAARPALSASVASSCPAGIPVLARVRIPRSGFLAQFRFRGMPRPRSLMMFF